MASAQFFIGGYAAPPSFVVSEVFANDTARDAFYTANPSLLIADTLIQSGSAFELYNGSSWQTVTTVVQGPAGPTGPAGALSSVGIQGPPQFSVADSPLTANGTIIIDNTPATNLGYDGSNRLVSYTQNGISYALTYGLYGIATKVGGGRTITYQYNGSGQLTGEVYS